MQMSGMCQQVYAIVNRLVAERQGLVWNIFETDYPDIPQPPPNDRSILIRFHPPNHHYVYDLIVKPPLQPQLERDIQAFIERNIP